MKKLNDPLYTVQTFINNFIGGKKILDEFEEQENSELYLAWNGDIIFVNDKKSLHRDITSGFARVGCYRSSPGIFQLSVGPNDLWFLEINFSDGGLVKNRIYRLRDYVN